LDVVHENSIREAVSYIITTEGQLDVLINNAAMALAGYCETTTEEEVWKIFDVNFFGVVSSTQLRKFT